MKTAAFILSGFFSGLASGGLGIGGAVVATPLIRFIGLSPYLAVGTTVPAIFPSAVTGARSYMKAGLVDRKAAAWAGAAGAVFAFLGARATRLVNGHLLMLATALLLLVLGLRVAKGPSAEPDARTIRTPVGGLLMAGGAAGLFSGLLGVGGGFLIVPVLNRFFHFPLKTALGTSLSAICIMSLSNVVGQAQAGNIDWKVSILLIAGVIPGARLGAAAAIRAKEKALRIGVATAIAAISVFYAAAELLALSSSR